MIKVNLVPIEILRKARQRQIALQAGVVGGLFAVVLVLLSFAHWFGLKKVEKDFEFKTSVLDKLKVVVARVEEKEKAAKAVRDHLDAIEGLRKARAFYPLFMSEFVRTVPSGVRITQLTTSTQANSSMKLTISAVANSNDDVAGWMRILEKNSHFAKVDLGAVTSAGNRQFSFTITTVYTLKI
jgi:Tfp pilus assembly protein PilN